MNRMDFNKAGVTSAATASLNIQAESIVIAARRDIFMVMLPSVYSRNCLSMFIMVQKAAYKINEVKNGHLITWPLFTISIMI